MLFCVRFSFLFAFLLCFLTWSWFYYHFWLMNLNVFHNPDNTIINVCEVGYSQERLKKNNVYRWWERSRVGNIPLSFFNIIPASLCALTPISFDTHIRIFYINIVSRGNIWDYVFCSLQDLARKFLISPYLTKIFILYLPWTSLFLYILITFWLTGQNLFLGS